MNEKNEYTHEQLCVVVDNIDAKTDQILSMVKLQNERMVTLEKWQSKIIGGLIIMSMMYVPLLYLVIEKVFKI